MHFSLEDKIQNIGLSRQENNQPLLQLVKATKDTHKNPPMGSAVWCHMTKGKNGFMHQQLSSFSSHGKNGPIGSSPDSTVCLSQTLKKKSQKVKQSPNPRKVRKIGEREKSTVETLSKKWLFGLFCRGTGEESKQKKWKKIVCKDRKNSLGEKSRGEAMLSSACLRDSTASVHIFSAEQEQLRGKNAWLFQLDKKRDT